MALDSHSSFDLRYHNGWAVLTIPPLHERRRPIYADDVAARMRLLGIPPVPARQLRECLENGDGTPQPIIPWPEGKSLGAQILITINDNQMEAHAQAIPSKPGGRPVDEALIHEALQNAGVVFGLRQKALHWLQDSQYAHRSILVAQGEKPFAGEPARTECLFVTQRGRPWKEIQGGRIDLKELHFIQDRKADDALTRPIPARPPLHGSDVLGNPLHAETPPNPPPLHAGEGVYEEDGVLYAALDGNVRLQANVVTVEPLVTVESVDYGTGNIDFDGSVSVEGGVADGFHIHAGGDVQIGKTLGRSQVKTQRNLLIRGGWAGDGEGKAQVKGDLYAKFLEGSSLQVEGNIHVTEAILHSEVEVNGNLVVIGGRGEITGGITAVGGSVFCRRIGSPYSPGTRLYVGCSPKLLTQFQNLAASLRDLRDETDELERRLNWATGRRGMEEEAKALTRTVKTHYKRLGDGAKELKSLKNHLSAPDGTILVAEDRLVPGSIISFGLDEFSLGDKALEKVMLRRENGRTVVHGLKPGEIPSLPSLTASSEP